jgi:hypothetical protein
MSGLHTRRAPRTAAKERVLVTVKTYPTLSRTYGETVCTAGVRADGSWVRIYPVPFRRLGQAQQYKKFDWLECRLLPSDKDPRPETRRAADFAELTPVGNMGTDGGWRERRALLLRRARVYTNLAQLIAAAKANEASLAVFRPTKIIDFLSEAEDREWDPKKLRAMRERTKQLDFYAEETWRDTFRVIPKLPFSFSYRFEDDAGKKSTMHVLDWETGALYWNCLRAADGNETIARAKVRQKYVDEFGKKDVHFFVGTTQEWHFRAPNPWVIVGVFPIPHELQPELIG